MNPFENAISDLQAGRVMTGTVKRMLREMKKMDPADRTDKTLVVLMAGADMGDGTATQVQIRLTSNPLEFIPEEKLGETVTLEPTTDAAQAVRDRVTELGKTIHPNNVPLAESLLDAYGMVTAGTERMVETGNYPDKAMVTVAAGEYTTDTGKKFDVAVSLIGNPAMFSDGDSLHVLVIDGVEEPTVIKMEDLPKSPAGQK